MFEIDQLELCRVLSAQAHGELPPGVLQGVSTDSRTLLPGSLYVPLRGERFDGHDYIGAARERGAALVLADREVSGPHLRVDDTLVAYQTLARWWRMHFDIPVIAVTGSAGKTTTRELIRAVLATAGPVLSPPGNENNDVGVPKLLLQLDESYRFCVVEMGMRGPGEIARLAATAQPTVGVITNVGTAHIGRLGSREAIAAAKCELLAQMDPEGGTAVLNGEDERLQATARQFWQGRTLNFALEAAEATSAAATPTLPVQTSEDGRLWVEGVPFVPPLPGRHNWLNFLAALTVARHLGLDLMDVSGRLGALELPTGRARIVVLPGNIRCIDETYNSAPESAQATLNWLMSLEGRRLAVLGQMRELGEFSRTFHFELGSHCARLGLDHLVVLDAGDDTEALVAGARGIPVVQLPDHQAIARYLRSLVRPGDWLLFKASRAVGLERAIEEFQASFHPDALPESAQ